MANKHYYPNEEIEVTLKLKVKIKTCSNYNPLNKEQLSEQVQDFKSEINEHLLGKLRNEYYQEDVTIGVDGWSYEVE